MEFALVLPLLLFVTAAVFLAAVAVWRQAAADYTLFAAAVGAGLYDRPVDLRAAAGWEDVTSAIVVRPDPARRRAEAVIRLRRERPWLFGTSLREMISGAGVARLWRFYPGPPSGDWE